MDGETPKRLYSEVVASGGQQGCLNGSVARKDNGLVIINHNSKPKKLESKPPRALLYPKCSSSGLCVEATLKPAAAARRIEKSGDSKRFRLGAAAGEVKWTRKSNNHYSTKPTREVKPRDSKISGSTSQGAATRRVEKPLYQAAKEKNPRDFKTKVNGADGKEEKRRRKWKSYYPRVHTTGEMKKLMDLDFSGYTWKGAEPTELGKLQDSPLWSSAAVQSAGLLEEAADTILVGGSLQSAVPTTMECSEDPTLVGDSLQSAVPTTMECSEDPTLVGGSLQSVVSTTMESSEDPTPACDPFQPVLSTKMECSGDLTFLDRISKLAHDSQSLLERRSERPHHSQDCNDRNIDENNSENVTKMLSDVLQDVEPIHVTHQEVSALFKSERGQTVPDPLLQTMHPRSENRPNPESSSMWDWPYPCKSFRPSLTVTSPCQVGASSSEKESVAEACKDLLQNEVTGSRETQSCRTPEHEILGSGPREQETTTTDRYTLTASVHQHNVAKRYASSSIQYPIQPSSIQYPIPPSSIQYPIQPSSIQYPIQPSIIPYPIQPFIIQYPIQPSIIQYPIQPSIIPYPIQPSSIQYPIQPSIIQYPIQPSIIPYPIQPSSIQYPFIPSIIPENPFTSNDAAGSDQSSSNSQPNAPVHQDPVYQLFSPTSSGGTQSSSDSQPNAPFYQNPVFQLFSPTSSGGTQSSSDSQPNAPVYQNPVYRSVSPTSSGGTQSFSDPQPNAPFYQNPVYRSVSPTSSGGTQSFSDPQPNAPFYQNPVYRSVSPTSSGGTHSSSDSQPNAPVHQNQVYRPFSPNHQNQIYTVTNSYAPVNAETTSGETSYSGGAQSSSDFQPRAPAAGGDAEARARMAAFESFVFQPANPNQGRLNERYPKPIHRALQPVWSNGYITRPMPDVSATVTTDGSLS